MLTILPTTWDLHTPGKTESLQLSMHHIQLKPKVALEPLTRVPEDRNIPAEISIHTPSQRGIVQSHTQINLSDVFEKRLVHRKSIGKTNVNNSKNREAIIGEAFETPRCAETIEVGEMDWKY